MQNFAFKHIHKKCINSKRQKDVQLQETLNG